MKEQWNKDIHDRLKDFPKKAPEGLLDDIKAEMSRRGLSPVPAHRTPKRIAFLRIASVAAALLILLGISQLWQEQPIPFPEESSLVKLPYEEVIPILPETEEADTRPALLTPSRRVAQAQPSVLQADTLVSEKETGTDGTKEEEHPKEKEKEEEKKETTSTPKERKWAYTPTLRKKSSLTLDAYFSGLVAQAGQTTKSRDMAVSGPSNNPPHQNPNGNPSNGGGENATGPDSTSTAVSSRALSRNAKEDGVHHHLPIKVGFSLRYSSDERWYVQSGLTYSYLATDISYSSSYTEQRLHYIGIPVQIGRQIGESKRFKAYISGGGQVEKLVSGKSTTRTTYGQTFTDNIRDKRLLFSALLSVGAEYALNKDVSLYAEPGVHYYFNNGNGLKTYYNEHPLNFNLTVGFRFHWKE